MLNEIWRLQQAIDKAEIEIPIPHPLIKPLLAPKRNLLRIRLNDDGHVVSVEDVADGERGGLWRIVQTSDGSFPVIKVNQPFLELPAESSIRDKIAKVRQESGQTELLHEAITSGAYRTWVNTGWHWGDSLDKANQLIKILSGDDQGAEGADIVRLARSFQQALQNATLLISEICTMAMSRLRTGQLGAINIVQELLIGKGRDSRQTNGKISVLLALELDHERSIYREQVRQLVAAILPTNLSDAKRKHEHFSAASAFGGGSDLLKEPFPQVKLPILDSSFPLISMASDNAHAKCNKRYGLTEYTACPVTSTQSRLMHSALKWLVTRDEGTTWRGVASGKYEIDPLTHKKKEQRDLLLVYVDDKPELEARTASYFGASPEIIEARFEADAWAVCDALSAVVQEHPRSRLNLFLIRKVSKGQVQVVLNESPAVSDVLEKADLWQRSIWENLPKITLYLQSAKDGREAVDTSPAVPYPEQLVRLLANQWVRDESSPIGANGKLQKASQEVIGPGLGDVLDLMLRTEGKWEPTAKRMLNLLIQRISPLLIGVFGAKHAYGPRNVQGMHEPFFDYPRESRKIALLAVAVLGLLLRALDCRKEDYMKDAPYQVGQVLALADTLHKDYCTVVRNGLPNVLVGTSLMRRALDSPVSALAGLGERMIEYVRWAKVVQIPKEWAKEDQKTIAVNEARKRLRQFQRLTSMLGDCKLPSECDDKMKAQLLLGFLASPPADAQDG
jgi:hypothetical protein